MARKVKDRILSTRVDDALGAKIDKYVEIAEMTQGELTRAAVIEYMENHPVKRPIPTLDEELKPGKEEPLS